MTYGLFHSILTGLGSGLEDPEILNPFTLPRQLRIEGPRKIRPAWQPPAIRQSGVAPSWLT